MYYYNQIYNKYNERHLQHEGYHMKHFLYYLRGIFACKWIEEYNSLPPMPFIKLVDATVDDYEIKSIRNNHGGGGEAAFVWQDCWHHKEDRR